MVQLHYFTFEIKLDNNHKSVCHFLWLITNWQIDFRLLRHTTDTTGKSVCIRRLHVCTRSPLHWPTLEFLSLWKESAWNFCLSHNICGENRCVTKSWNDSIYSPCSKRCSTRSLHLWHFSRKTNKWNRPGLNFTLGFRDELIFQSKQKWNARAGCDAWQLRGFLPHPRTSQIFSSGFYFCIKTKDILGITKRPCSVVI